MSWYGKEQTTPFDTQPIEGLHFLDGDILAVALQQYWTEGQKMPLIQFPSSLEFQLWDSPNYKQGIVHLFGELDLPYGQQNRDVAYQRAQHIAEQLGYIVEKVGDNQLALHGFAEEDHLLITYDNEAEHMIDVQQIAPTAEKAKHPGHILMNEAIAAQLPPLYSNEDIGLEALAPVKYFHANGWYWYATEYNPETGVFFGLVVGFEIEVGYFSLPELEDIGQDGRTLPIERDLYYEPQSLAELQKYHRRLRGEIS